jgi:threonine dehydrogenase-like Zn-dependent dehydrogenase
MTLLSSRNSTAADFRRIIGLMESGQIDTTPWITHRSPLDGMIDQFPTWLDPANRVLKAIVEVNE